MDENGGVPVMAQQKQIQLGTMKLRVRSLALLSGLWIWHCHELWCSLVAIALIRLLAWEPPYAVGVALKSKNNNNNKLNKRNESAWKLKKEKKDS